ncbi:unnamed protein product [Rotaria sp. Silwood2]|nr:unnamed protein product [Rotaria sp. Silwood2]CAF4498787.1 unnamed protein product [Rotaria sp. Silwood2]
MVNLHTFTVIQTFFSKFTIEWTIFENLTSSNVMPILQHANISLFININDLNRISSSSLFTDHRHVDVHFTFNLINCPQYIKVTQYIPRGNRFHPREIIGVTFVVNHWSSRSEWFTDKDPFSSDRQYYHHMWYTLPWTFDEFFHEYIPYRWITNIQVFEKPSQKMLTINQSPLHVLDAAGQILSLPIYALPHVVLLNCIETLHLSFYNRPIHISLSALRNITLVNSINCLKNYSSFPTTIRSIRILLFHDYPNYMLPNWSIVSNSLSNLLELSSVRVFMYDLPEAIDDTSCQMIAKIARLFSDFGFCFRRKFHSSNGDYINSVFNEHRKFIKQLCDYILLLSLDKQMYYSIEDDGCGLIIWF